MQAIPVSVTDVTIFKVFNPTEPLEEIMVEKATGSYAVGTLTTNVFYNLDLNADGKVLNKLVVHQKYYAVGKSADGTYFTTPWMYCLDNSDTPKFGRTVTYGPLEEEMGVSIPKIFNPSDYVKIASLTDIAVSQLFPGEAIGQVALIKDGVGSLIVTKFGTPHLMGIEVTKGEIVGKLEPGQKRIIASGKTSDGSRISRSALTVITANFPVVLLEEFFE